MIMDVLEKVPPETEGAGIAVEIPETEEPDAVEEPDEGVCEAEPGGFPEDAGQTHGDVSGSGSADYVPGGDGEPEWTDSAGSPGAEAEPPFGETPASGSVGSGDIPRGNETVSGIASEVTVSGNDAYPGTGDGSSYYLYSSADSEPADLECLLEIQNGIFYGGFACQSFALGLIIGVLLVQGFRFRRV